jgi:hypothetical protein
MSKTSPTEIKRIHRVNVLAQQEHYQLKDSAYKKPVQELLLLLCPQQHQLKTHHRLVRLLKRDGINWKRPMFNDLKCAYAYVSTIYRMRLEEGFEHESTKHEGELRQRLQNDFKGIIRRSYVIGPHVCDLFIPSVTGGGHVSDSCGLAIEVDGRFYSTSEKKNSKCDFKEEMLREVGVVTARLENRDVYCPVNHQYLKQVLKPQKPVSSSRLNVMYLRIFAYTLAYHLEKKDSEELFGFDISILPGYRQEL